MSEQRSDFMIDACEMCGQFHRVAWYDIDGDEHLMCDSCLGDYERNVATPEETHKKSKVIS
jgi:ribosome-binding protein aMBF1 (putative translation factor)